MASQAQKEISF